MLSISNTAAEREEKKINNLPTVITDLLIASQQWQAKLFASLSPSRRMPQLPRYPLKSASTPAYWHLAVQRWLRAPSDKLHFLLTRMILVLLILNGFFRYIFSLSYNNRPFAAVKKVFPLRTKGKSCMVEVSVSEGKKRMEHSYWAWNIRGARFKFQDLYNI